MGPKGFQINTFTGLNSCYIINKSKTNRNTNVWVPIENWSSYFLCISSCFLQSNDNDLHFNYLDMGKTRHVWNLFIACGTQTHVYSTFLSLLLIIESDNKRLEVQFTTELAWKLICHRKYWSNFQWQVARNVCFGLALNPLITSSKLLVSLHALSNSCS